MTTPGIPDLFTYEHLEGVGIPDFSVRIVLEFHIFFFFFGQQHLEFQTFVKPVLDSIFFCGEKNYPL